MEEELRWKRLVLEVSQILSAMSVRECVSVSGEFRTTRETCSKDRNGDLPVSQSLPHNPVPCLAWREKQAMHTHPVTDMR